MAIDIEILSCNNSSVEIDSCCAAIISGGSFNPGDFILRPEFISSSGALQSEINSISIATGSLTGNFYPRFQNPSGYLINLDLSGASGILQNQINNISTVSTGTLTGAFINRTESGNFYSILNLNQYSNSGNLYQSGANLFINDTVISGKLISLSGDLILSGRNLDNKIISLSGDFISFKSADLTGVSVTGSSTIVGLVNLTGLGGLQVNLSGGNIITFSGGAAANLLGFGTTGSFDLRYYNISNSNNYLSSGNTGRFYDIGNVNNYISSGVTGILTGAFVPRGETGKFYQNNTSNYANSGDLFSTGSYLLGLINGIVSADGLVTTGQTGQFYSIQNVNNYTSSGSLTSTGIFIENQLTSLSGDLIITGRNLDNKIGVLSGQIVYTNQTGNFYRDNINSYSTSGNVANTGADLLSRHQLLSGNLISLSGDLITSGRNLDNKFLFTGIAISGGINANTNLFTVTNSSGIGTFIVNTSGNVAVGDFIKHINAPPGLGAFNIQKGASGLPIFLLQNTNNFGYSSMDFFDETGLHSMAFGHGNTSGKVPSFQRLNYINSVNGFPFAFMQNSAEFIRILSGKFGVLTNNPIYNIDVSGSGNFTNGIYWNNIPVLTGLDSSTGNLVGLWQTGGFYGIQNINNYTTSGALTISGNFIENQINSLSGDLQTSGANLLNRIGLLSGNLITTGQTLLNSDSILSGNISTTGNTILARQLSLSGDLGLTGQNLNNQLRALWVSGVTGVSISGGASMTGFINLNPGLNITLNQIGLTGVTISAASAGGASVSGASGIITQNSGAYVSISPNFSFDQYILYQRVFN